MTVAEAAKAAVMPSDKLAKKMGKDAKKTATVVKGRPVAGDRNISRLSNLLIVACLNSTFTAEVMQFFGIYISDQNRLGIYPFGN